jgi:hypothetical protein
MNIPAASVVYDGVSNLTANDPPKRKAACREVSVLKTHAVLKVDFFQGFIRTGGVKTLSE